MGYADFDFGLTAEQEARARKLHDESIVIDILFQGPVGYASFTEDMKKQLEEEWEQHRNPGLLYMNAVIKPIRAAINGEFDEFRAVWEQSGLTAGNRQAGFDDALGLATVNGINQAQFDKLPWLVKALRADDFRTAKAEGKRAGFVSTQNTTGLDPQLRMLDAVYDLGMRMINLAYNNMNAVASGCTERTDAGVSNFGARAIARMNELGIIVDTCHCGRQTTLDACALSTKPVVASHNSAKGLYPVDRGKSDEELKAVANSGGVVGVYAVPFFLAPGEDVTIEAMLDHIDYIANLIGWQYVAIGTDWPLQSPKDVLAKALMPMVAEMGFRPEHNIAPETNLIGFDDYRDLPNITRGLVKRGYQDDQIKGILGENFLRVFADVCG